MVWFYLLTFKIYPLLNFSTEKKFKKIFNFLCYSTGHHKYNDERVKHLKVKWFVIVS